VVDTDIRHQTAQVYGPCVIAEEKAAQRDNAAEGQHQDSPKGARRLSKQCPQCRWDDSATPALMLQLCPTLPILFAASGQHTDIQTLPDTQGSRAAELGAGPKI